MGANKANLLAELQSLPETLPYFPSRAYQYADGWSFDFPYVEEFRVGVIVDPCKHKEADCCMNTFGTPEYGALLRNGLEEGRKFKMLVLANDTDIMINSNLVYEDGSPVPTSSSRAPDDESYIDLECRGASNPYARCRGK